MKIFLFVFALMFVGGIYAQSSSRIKVSIKDGKIVSTENVTAENNGGNSDAFRNFEQPEKVSKVTGAYDLVVRNVRVVDGQGPVIAYFLP